MQEHLFMTVRLSRLAVPSGDLPVEVIEEALLPELGVVMASAYAGTTDDEGGSDSEALAELNNASRGEYGEPIRNCWLAARVDIVLAGAVICTRSENLPFIAFVFTDHAFTRRGIARQLILEIGGRLSETHHEGLHPQRALVCALRALDTRRVPQPGRRTRPPQPRRTLTTRARPLGVKAIQALKPPGIVAAKSCLCLVTTNVHSSNGVYAS
jgi:hypothetical protein